MVWEHNSRQAEIFHDDDDRFALRLGTMPPNTIAWLGGHTGRETFFAAAGNGSSVPGSAIELQTHVTTFAYERLVIQVLSVRPYKYANPYALIDCNQRYEATPSSESGRRSTRRFGLRRGLSTRRCWMRFIAVAALGTAIHQLRLSSKGIIPSSLHPFRSSTRGASSTACSSGDARTTRHPILSTADNRYRPCAAPSGSAR
jgi:hypothetical protein